MALRSKCSLGGQIYVERVKDQEPNQVRERRNAGHVVVQDSKRFGKVHS